MKLTKLIIEYWKIWMTVPEKTNLWCHSWNWEGLTYYDGYITNFWYLLNYNYYKMNNKQFAYTSCELEFEEPRDFEEF